jgi:hypothetical protein
MVDWERRLARVDRVAARGHRSVGEVRVAGRRARQVALERVVGAVGVRGPGAGELLDVSHDGGRIEKGV